MAVRLGAVSRAIRLEEEICDLVEPLVEMRAGAPRSFEEDEDHTHADQSESGRPTGKQIRDLPLCEVDARGAVPCDPDDDEPRRDEKERSTDLPARALRALGPSSTEKAEVHCLRGSPPGVAFPAASRNWRI